MRTRPPPDFKGALIKTLAIVFLALTLVSTSAHAQYIYLSDQPNAECMSTGFGSGYYFIYLHSPDDADFDTADFQLRLEGFNPAAFISASAMQGAVVISGDIFAGIEVSINYAALNHHPILVVRFDPSLSHFSRAITREVALTRSGGSMVSLPNLTTIGFNCGCAGCSVFGRYEDPVVDVVIGQTTEIPFEYSLKCAQPGTFPYSATDALGWVVEMSPGTLLTTNLCGEGLIPDWRSITATAFVPANVAPGTFSSFNFYGDRLLLRAVQSLGVEARSWGKLKMKYVEEVN